MACKEPSRWQDCRQGPRPTEVRRDAELKPSACPFPFSHYRHLNENLSLFLRPWFLAEAAFLLSSEVLAVLSEESTFRAQSCSVFPRSQPRRRDRTRSPPREGHTSHRLPSSVPRRPSRSLGTVRNTWVGEELSHGPLLLITSLLARLALEASVPLTTLATSWTELYFSFSLDLKPIIWPNRWVRDLKYSFQ